MNRPMNLIECECWDVGERLKLPEKFKGLIFFNPLFICKPNKGVGVYYNFTDPKQRFEPVINFLSKNLKWLKSSTTHPRMILKEVIENE